jgi:hypothetical protein
VTDFTVSSSDLELEQRLLDVQYQESAMTRMERLREPLSQPLEEDYFKRRLKQGWRPVAIHWEREVEGGRWTARSTALG